MNFNPSRDCQKQKKPGHCVLKRNNFAKVDSLRRGGLPKVREMDGGVEGEKREESSPLCHIMGRDIDDGASVYNSLETSVLLTTSFERFNNLF